MNSRHFPSQSPRPLVITITQFHRTFNKISCNSCTPSFRGGTHMHSTSCTLRIPRRKTMSILSPTAFFNDMQDARNEPCGTRVHQPRRHICMFNCGLFSVRKNQMSNPRRNGCLFRLNISGYRRESLYHCVLEIFPYLSCITPPEG